MSSQSVAEVKVSVTSISQGEKFKTGQKYATPAPGNGDRVFYETLYQQNPQSEMAQEWCVSYGVLSEKEANHVYNAICKRKGKPGMISSPDPKRVAPVSKGRKVRVDDDVEDDTGFDAGSAWEMQGKAGI